MNPLHLFLGGGRDRSFDRMPVLLKPDQFEHWLSGNMGVEELKPVENDYSQRWAVSKRINSSTADSNDPTLIHAVRQAA
jgi:putative SOS response-associated peptidase YedK